MSEPTKESCECAGVCSISGTSICPLDPKMSKLYRWHDGIPAIQFIEQHESDHTPKNKTFKLGELTVAYSETNSVARIKSDEDVYGDWLCDHPDHYSLGRYQSHLRLKAAEGRVWYAIGFCQWGLLDLTTWAKTCRFYPVGKDGLPVGFSV